MARPLAWLLTAGAALGAPVAGAPSIDGYPASRFIEQHDRFVPEGGAPVELRFLIAREGAAQTARLVQATHAALTLLSSWFGPPALSAVEGPPPPLTVAGVPWRGSAAADVPGDVIATPLRLLNPRHDRSMERALIAATIDRYWQRPGAARPSPFEESLSIYVSGRAIDHLLESRNFATQRFFGGFVPLPLRSLSLSPPLSDRRPRAFRFDDRESIDAGVARGVRALQTIERYVGWPTMLEAIALLARTSDRRDVGALAAVLSDVRGADVRSLVAECLRADAVFDYSLDGLQSAPGAAGLIETTVTVNRRGSGRFANGDETGDREAAMPLLVRFADGTQARDFFDGAAPSSTLIYSAKTAAIAATIDPDVMLVLDDNRDNNTMIHAAPTSRLGIRLALNWMAWLQNTMLSYTALV